MNGKERKCLHPDVLQYMDQEGSFSSVTDEQKKNILDRARACIGLNAADKKGCAVCDSRWQSRSIRRCRIEGLTAERWCSILQPCADVPMPLISYYDISEWVPNLKGAMLSRNGVVRNDGGMPIGKIFVCDRCYKCMSQSTDRPPKFSIANGFDIGRLPENLRNANVIERRVTSLTSIAIPLTVLTEQYIGVVQN